MIKLVLTALLLCGCIGAIAADADLDALIFKLADDEFDVREDATEKLSNYPAEYAYFFRKYAQAWNNNPEIKTRLLKASREIWKHKILTQSEKWQRLNGTIGIDIEVSANESYWERYKNHTEAEGRKAAGDKSVVEEEFKVYGFKVNTVNGLDEQSAGKLLQEDLITEINGKSADDIYNNPLYMYGIFQPGQTYKLKIKRMQETAESQHRTDLAEAKFETNQFKEYEQKVLEVEITARLTELYQLNYYYLREVYVEEWSKFLSDYERKYGE